jgi:hypothetical protein
MHSIYLFFLSFVFNSHSSTNYVSGFVSHLPHTHYKTHSHTHTQTHISQTQQLRAKTCFADDDDHGNSKPNQNIIPNIPIQDVRVGMRNIVKSPLYIVIWKDCEDCTELLYNMELLDVKYFYFNVDERMGLSEDLENADFHGEDAEDQRQIVERRNSEKKVWNNLKYIQTQIPIFYKDDVYLGNKLMDIYCELYPM